MDCKHVDDDNEVNQVNDDQASTPHLWNADWMERVYKPTVFVNGTYLRTVVPLRMDEEWPTFHLENVPVGCRVLTPAEAQAWQHELASLDEFDLTVKAADSNCNIGCFSCASCTKERHQGFWCRMCRRRYCLTCVAANVPPGESSIGTCRQFHALQCPLRRFSTLPEQDADATCTICCNTHCAPLVQANTACGIFVCAACVSMPAGQQLLGGEPDAKIHPHYREFHPINSCFMPVAELDLWSFVPILVSPDASQCILYNMNPGSPNYHKLMLCLRWNNSVACSQLSSAVPWSKWWAQEGQALFDVGHYMRVYNRLPVEAV